MWQKESYVESGPPQKQRRTLVDKYKVGQNLDRWEDVLVPLWGKDWRQAPNEKEKFNALVATTYDSSVPAIFHTGPCKLQKTHASGKNVYPYRNQQF